MSSLSLRGSTDSTTTSFRYGRVHGKVLGDETGKTGIDSDRRRGETMSHYRVKLWDDVINVLFLFLSCSQRRLMIMGVNYHDTLK